MRAAGSFLGNLFLVTVVALVVSVWALVLVAAAIALTLDAVGGCPR